MGYNRAMRDFIRSEAFDSRDVAAVLEKEKHEIKKAQKQFKDEMKHVKKLRMKQLNVKLEKAHRMAFIEYYLRGRPVRKMISVMST